MRFMPFPLLGLLGVLSCSAESARATAFPEAIAARAVVTYKQNVRTSYGDAVTAATVLRDAVDAFVRAPSAPAFEAARKAWIDARVRYAVTEAFRFYDGPIDDPETGPEGRINGWPLDESAIDYTRDEPESGLVNDLSVVDLTAGVIAAENERKGEKSITSGWHAIEFLLWGQDDPTPGTGPGRRPFTDYVDGSSSPNQARRRTYLQNVTQLLVDDLARVYAAWDLSAPGSFGAKFGADPLDPSTQPDARKEVISKLLRSIGSMAKAELSGERMTVAFKNRSQEDEHSCFSDTTASDLLGNARGLADVWFGRHGAADGVGLDEVVSAVDASIAAKTSADLEASVSKLQVLVQLQDRGTPIDVVLQAPDGSEGRRAMLEAIGALKAVGDDVEKAAAALGLSVTLERPSEDL